MVKIDKVTNSITQPDVWLCHRNYDKICILSPIDDLKIYKTANAVDEISFTFHKINDDVEFEYWEQVKDLKVVLVDGFGYFEIAVDKNVSDDTKKVITGVSTEAELGQISIYELEINGENDLNNDANFSSDGGYIATTLYNPLDQEHSLLHKLLSKAPHWSFGSIAETITDNGKEVSSSQIKRTFNFDNTNIYDALQEIAKEFDVVFTFNTVNRKINMYDLNKVGEDTTVYVSTENLANDFTCTSNKDSIKNCFKIVGGDDLINSTIRSINANGSDYIYYFSPEQMDDMSDGLKTSLRAYDDLCEENKEEYENVCSDLYDAIDEVNELETAMFPDRPSLSPTTASAEIQKLTASNLGDIPVEKIDSLYETGAKRAVETIAQLKVDYRYEVDIENGYAYDSTAHTFTCKFKVTSANDSAVSSTDIVLNLVEDQKETLQQKINNMLGEVDIEDSDITTFKTNLNNYSQKYLEDYTSIYKECTKVLSERGYDNKDKVIADLYNFYHDYWEKWKACEEALAIRKSQVATASANKKELENKLKELQDKLNFEKCLGGYYEEFCKYRREDTYQNDNYISDGMDTSELFKNAKQLVETATKELIKASTFQTTYTANLNNLFTNPIYEPFYEHFELFNWIHADIDDKHIMLRLMGITFDFSSIDKIEVEFSEQVRNANGLTDLQSILGQAKSMATSYSSTVKQALNGSEVCLEFDTLKQEGLNSALMNIKNSNNEEVVIDNCGINCKSKDQNDQYDMCQLRITGKNIVMTDDDFETARLAIGKILINYDSDGDGIKEPHEEYGIVADCIIGDLIAGQTLLIANSTGTFIVDKDGIIVKNMKLDMSNADGTRRIVIDPELDSILSIYTNSKQVFYVDVNGNMCMLGNLYVNNNNMYLKVDMTSENIIEVGYGEITGTGNEGEAGSGEGGVSTGNYVGQMWEQVDYGQDIYNGTVPIIKAGLADYSIAKFNNATLFKQQCFLNYGGEIYHLVYGGYLIKYNEKQKTWNLVTKIENKYVSSSYYYYSSLVKTDKEDGNIYIYHIGGYSNSWGVLLKYNLETGVLNEVWTNGVSTSNAYGYNYGRHYIKGDTFYVANYAGNVYSYTPSKVTLNSDRSYSVGGYSQWAPENTVIHEMILYNGDEYAIISIGQSKVMLIKFKNIDAFTYDTLYTFDYTMSSDLRTGGIIADAFNDKIVIVFKHMSIHYVYDIKTDTMNIADEFKISLLYNSAESPNCGDKIKGVSGFSMIASKDKLHMFAIGANQCYGGDIRTGSYSLQYNWKDLNYIPQYYIRHYEYLADGKIETNKNFEKLTSGYNFYMSRQCSFTKIGDTIYNIPTFWQMLSGSTEMNSKTANYTSWDVPIYALDTTSKDNDFQIICNNIGVQIVCLINSNSTSKIYFFAGTDATYLQYYDLDTQTVGSVFTDDNGNRVASNLGWCLFSYLDENEQILYEMGTDFVRLDLTTNTVLEKTSLGLSVHSNVEVINDEFYFVSLTSDGSKTKLYKITKSGVLSTVATMQEADDIGSNTGYSIAYYNNKIHMYYASNGVLKRKRYQYSFDTGEVTSYNDMFQDNGMYVYDCFWDISTTCHLPAIATSTGIHYFTGTTYNFDNKFTNPFNHYLYTEIGSTPTDPEDPDNPNPPPVDNPSDKIFYITNEGDGYFYGTVYAKDGRFSGDIIARSLTLGENAVVKGNISATTGSIGGWEIATNGLKSVGFDTSTGISLDSTGNIFAKGSSRYLYVADGQMYIGDGNVVDTSKKYSYISSEGVYLASDESLSQGEWLFEANINEDWVVVSTHSPAKPALYVRNRSNTDTSNILGDASGIRIQTDYAGFSNRPLDVITKTGNDDGTQAYIYMNVFGEYKGSGDGSSYDTQGRLTLRSAINTGTGWIGNDTSLSNGYIPSSIGSTAFRWGQGFFHDLTITNPLKVTSDKKLKDHIDYLDSKESLEFINRLQPAEYTMTYSENKRVHRGFYAQDVSKVSNNMGFDNLSLYSAYVEKDGEISPYDANEDDENLRWSLSYDEFIAPMVSAMQELSKENNELKDKVTELEVRLEKLEKLLLEK